MNNKFWPEKLSEYSSGLSDDELELMIDRTFLKGLDNTIGYKSIPWFFWVTEIYSFGKCYREIFNWPWYLPIPLYGDHGVCLLSYFEPHEEKNGASYHFSWFTKRVSSLKNNEGNKSIIHITHPWVLYRRKKELNLEDKSEGTIVFYTHTNDGIELDNFDDDKYFNELSALPAEFHPIRICLHQHDINKGYHKRLRKYGFPILTFGLTTSPFFVDRFYDVLTKTKYATSAHGGSDLFYCHELGVKYFILGKEPKLTNIGHKEKPLGELYTSSCNLYRSTEDIKRKLFSVSEINNIELDQDRDKFVREVLGLDLYNKDNDYLDIRKILFKEVFSKAHLYLWVLVKKTVQKVFKN
ncbi:hypothetical protein [Cognaticolwellia beringensis]|uniref:Uncharacterized protein n=1 Tax=Cognaticolwellia beringensis TaxID=1967665 RepID=A0A222G489_9GAMM|nr:hypothetical protein [Cognaticolwellia beringensis]ASP46639.1 hypothetical protein B5D82_01895 [Cognaticolwellia beringensis]